MQPNTVSLLRRRGARPNGIPYQLGELSCKKQHQRTAFQHRGRVLSVARNSLLFCRSALPVVPAMLKSSQLPTLT